MKSSKRILGLNDNETLTAYLRNGDEAAYGFLADRFYKRLYAYALSLIGDHSLAEDIVQNVFVKTWLFRDRLDARFPIQSFLFRSVYNEFINQYQKNRSMLLLQRKYVEFLKDTVDQTEEPEWNRMIQILREEIGNLPPKCQEIFTLSKKEGLTNMEISEYLDVSVKTVEAQITKAFSILKEKMGVKVKVFLILVSGIKRFSF